MTNFTLLAGGIAGWWASIEDAMAEAAVNTVIGISVVFAALLLFVFVISLFKYIYLLDQKMQAKKSGKAPAPKKAPAPAPAPVAEVAPATDDLELIAVITAAIHAYEEAQGNTVTGDLVVRSIKKRNSRWQNA
ncbi:MAG: OadG family protein [Lachnospiraceae bacterium]|nr:OadG family protein [Lachnospiraceae bacterium]MBP3593352.1 OadG family protein [Lachnospiraceae bacterium]